MVAERGQPTVSAASAKPAISAPVPSTPSAYVGTYELSPIMTAPTTTADRLPPVRTRRPKTQSGRIGSAAFRSTRTKAPRMAAPMTKTDRPGTDVQAHDTPPSSRPRITSELLLVCWLVSVLLFVCV